jgi:TonB-like protein
MRLFGTSRDALVAALAFIGLVAPCARADAQTLPAPTPVPTAAACAQPNFAGATVRAFQPDTPDLAVHYGIDGLVNVIVTLDRDSRVVNARILSASNPIFVETALEAARRSTFRTTIRDCQPLAADFVFTVHFDAGHPRVTLFANPMQFFPGTWSCRDTVAGGNRSMRFSQARGGGLEIDDAGFLRTIALDQYGVWIVREGSRRLGFAFPWVDRVWSWNLETGAVKAEYYERLDDRTFEHTLVPAAADAPTRTERCTRASVG